jgi:sulfur carrier protein
MRPTCKLLFTGRLKAPHLMGWTLNRTPTGGHVRNMTLTVNGEIREFADDITVQNLLEALELTPAATVVERNGDIVERGRYADTTLKNGDTLELVRFVGGG